MEGVCYPEENYQSPKVNAPVPIFPPEALPKIRRTSNGGVWEMILSNSKKLKNSEARVSVLAGTWPRNPIRRLREFYYYVGTHVLKRNFWRPAAAGRNHGRFPIAQLVRHPRLTQGGKFDFQYDIDGGCSRNKNKGCYSFILYDRNGNILKRVSQNVNGVSSMYHEQQGIYFCLVDAHANGRTTFRVVTDCKFAVEMLLEPDRPNEADENEYDEETISFIRQVREYYEQNFDPGLVEFLAVLRQGNYLADAVAKRNPGNLRDRVESGPDHPLTAEEVFFNTLNQLDMGCFRYRSRWARDDDC